MGYLLAAVPFIVIWAIASMLLAMMFRRVVPTNENHTIQKRKKTVSYGKDQPAGNVYYAWPAWMPVIGIRVIKLPVSVFAVKLDNYDAYDKGRVPFMVDVLAFFRVEEPNVAAQRVGSFEDLAGQLKGILQGASRSILAQAPINEILEKRADYGKMFTDATASQLKQWGVVNVKNIELMDIRDAAGAASKSIQNIMAIRQSEIEKESRVAVANNQQTARTAEISATQTVSVREQEAQERIGVRMAEREQAMGVAEQQAQQAINEQKKETAEKEMAVNRVNTVRAAEITKDQGITKAEGDLRQAQLHADATRATGEAEGAAKQAVLMAPVNTQIELAARIGENKPYQEYLINIRKVEKDQAVGIEQAKALAAADIRVIANAGNAVDGVKSAMELFTAKGGTQLGAALEALNQTDIGKAFIDRFTNGGAAHDESH